MRDVAKQRMDAVIVVAATRRNAQAARRQSGRADRLRASRHPLKTEFRERDRHGFAFMATTSRPAPGQGSVARIAAMRARRQAGRRAHRRRRRAGRRPHRRRRALLGDHPPGLRRRRPGGQRAGRPRHRGCPLGRRWHRSGRGAPVEQGHRNHMAAINSINRPAASAPPSRAAC